MSNILTIAENKNHQIVLHIIGYEKCISGFKILSSCKKITGKGDRKKGTYALKSYHICCIFLLF